VWWKEQNRNPIFTRYAYDVDVASVGVVAGHYFYNNTILFGRFDKRDEVMEPPSKQMQLNSAWIATNDGPMWSSI
jgi:hypothetical protein